MTGVFTVIQEIGILISLKRSCKDTGKRQPSANQSRHLRRNQSCPHLGLGLLASKIVKNFIPIVLVCDTLRQAQQTNTINLAYYSPMSILGVSGKIIMCYISLVLLILLSFSASHIVVSLGLHSPRTEHKVDLCSNCLSWNAI